MRKRVSLKLFLKIAFMIGLLYFLTQRGFLSVRDTSHALKQWDLILPSIVCFLTATCLGVVRWRGLLTTQGILLPWLRAFQLSMIGNFFNIALPGAVSGDFVKAFYVGKHYPGQKAQAFGSILFDRVAGLSALVLLSAGAALLHLRKTSDGLLFESIELLLLLGASAVVLFYAYLFLVKEHWDPVLIMLKKTEQRLPRLSSLTRVYASLRSYHNHRWAVLQALFLSLVIHLAVGWACYQLALALGETDISLLSLYVIVPLGLLVTAVPVAPAGIGTGNFAFFYFFGLIGSQKGADVFSLYAFFNIITGLIGGAVYFKSSVRAEKRTEKAVPTLDS